MTNPIKQVVSTAVLCLAGFLFFVACKKESQAKEMQSGNGASYTNGKANADLSGEITNSAARQGGTTPTEGQACSVTEGPNKGKTGTYSTDSDGSLWCEGSWGGTECGTNKCASVALPPRNVPVTLPKYSKVIK